LPLKKFLDHVFVVRLPRTVDLVDILFEDTNNFFLVPADSHTVRIAAKAWLHHYACKLTAAIPRDDFIYPVGHELFGAGNALVSEGFDHVVLVSMNSPASRWISRHVEILRYLVRSHDARITYREHRFHTVSVQIDDEIGDGPVVVGRNPELRLKAGGRAGFCARQVAYIDVNALVATPLQGRGDIITVGICANDNHCLSLLFHVTYPPESGWNAVRVLRSSRALPDDNHDLTRFGRGIGWQGPEEMLETPSKKVRLC